jgi:hypothetical protein
MGSRSGSVHNGSLSVINGSLSVIKMEAGAGREYYKKS